MYPVAELIDRDRLTEALRASVERARRVRDEWVEERAVNCDCWSVGAGCDWCEVNS